MRKTENFQLGFAETPSLGGYILTSSDIDHKAIIKGVILKLRIYQPRETAQENGLTDYEFWGGEFEQFFIQHFGNAKKMLTPEKTGRDFDDFFVGAVLCDAVFTDIKDINAKLEQLFILLKRFQKEDHQKGVMVSIDQSWDTFDLLV